MDPRIGRLADLLVDYSNPVRAGDQVLIGGPPAAEPLLAALFDKVLAVGAQPTCEIEAPWVQESLLRYGRKKQLAYVPGWKVNQAETLDCLFRVIAETNTRALSGMDPKRQQERMLGLKPLREVLRRRMDDKTLRWNVTLFPTEAHAQDADMSLSEFENFVYAACKADRPDPVSAWKRIRREQKRIVEFLTGRKKIRIVARETDLTLSVAGRAWVNCCGTANMPDGEVFTGPVEDSAEGTILFSFPACREGREVEGVHLTFQAGKVTAARASKNLEYLNAMLDLDSGSRYLGEFSFATNRDIQRFTKNILFDEKIGGTVHLALGSSYAETGGKNRSVLHWDMICDLRQGGRAYVDGKLFLKDGAFVAL
ncbi:MAG: aminopeptidase [Candidatus Omnitrophica bacterium]|nr:aminopeptidase [Candidatus Omnitrophota bacterium]